MRVLLTGARAPVTLDMARHFSRMGHDVYLADSLRLPLARLSRVVQRTFFVSRPAQFTKHYIDDMVGIARKWKIDWIVPTCEEIFFLSANLNAFDGVSKVFCEPLAVLEKLHNKWAFSTLVQSLGHSITSPESHLIDGSEGHRSWCERSDLQLWVFKPTYSRFASKTLISPDKAELCKVSPGNDEPWIAQRRVHGTEFSTYSILHRGELAAHVCYRSKYRAGLGAGIYFEPMDHFRIREFVQEFGRKQRFTGQVGFDFMEDETGNVFVLECNPRATSGLHMLHGLPVADAIFERGDTCIEPVVQKPCMLASAMWLVAMPGSISQGKVRSILLDMWRARDVVFSWNDPMPGVLSLFSLIEVAGKAFKERISLAQASTKDIEWNGEPIESPIPFS